VANLPKQKNNVVNVPHNKSNDKKICSDCKKPLSLTNFYNTSSVLSSDGKLDICKKCVSKRIDYNDMNTIYKILQQMDIPFLYAYWRSAIEKTPDNPWGTYIRMANSKINEFAYTSWKDSSFKPEVIETSNISDNESNITSQNNRPENFTPNEVIYEKWGYGYSNEEYYYFEKKYHQLKNNYPEKTAMHTEALLNYIRYRVKEELATARGDVKEAKEWGGLAKEAATAAKINPSQLSAADLADGLSGFGQLVRAVEQAVDIVEILPKFKQSPQDNVDFTLWCYINYARELKGLGECKYEDIYGFYEQKKIDMNDKIINNYQSIEDEEIKEGDEDNAIL
jgi:hypothetical protein